MEEVKFYVRCYDKIELARMYFPNLSNPVSVAKLRREVRLIVRYLGEPDGYVFMHEHADVK